MTIARAHSFALMGLSAQPVRVEADLANGLPQFSIVGLPSAAVREARDRVRAALVNSGFGFPDRRVTVNLAPADLPKDSGRFDLAIALAILAASGKIPGTALRHWAFAGELSLSGELLPIRAGFAYGLSAMRQIHAFERTRAQKANSVDVPQRLMAPSANASELSLVGAGPSILCARSLQHACELLNSRGANTQVYARPRASSDPNNPDSGEMDLADDGLRWESIQGQVVAQQAAMVAAAGHHNLLLVGPPGVGKSMIAERLIGLLPPLSEAASREVLAIHSLENNAAVLEAGAEMGHALRLWRRPPYRAPHHTTTARALIGGGYPISLGEISRAHQGVLFLDELPEFPRESLESLREPLETGQVTVVRVKDRQTLPARVLLVGAMNPCPCGYFGSSSTRKVCNCSSDKVVRYQGRLSGPLLERFDLIVYLDSVLSPPEHLPDPAPLSQGLMSTEQRKDTVARARRRAWARQGCSNAELSTERLLRFAVMTDQAENLLHDFASKEDLSRRVIERLRRVALTLADLENQDRIDVGQISEAICLRRALDRPAALGGLTIQEQPPARTPTPQKSGASPMPAYPQTA